MTKAIQRNLEKTHITETLPWIMAERQKNKMSWDKRTSKGTIGNRDKTIKLSNSYTIKWEDYSDKDFKYLMNTVDNI